jgi:hypothetical protein
VPLAVLLGFLLRHRVPGSWPGEDLRLGKLAGPAVMTCVAGSRYGGLYLLSPGNLWPSVPIHGLTDSVGFVSLCLGVSPA